MIPAPHRSQGRPSSFCHVLLRVLHSDLLCPLHPPLSKENNRNKILTCPLPVSTSVYGFISIQSSSTCSYPYQTSSPSSSPSASDLWTVLIPAPHRFHRPPSRFWYFLHHVLHYDLLCLLHLPLLKENNKIKY